MARYIRADKKKSGTYYWLVEAHRQGGKVVQKRLKYLGTKEPIWEYRVALKDIDDNVVYTKGRPEYLYLVEHINEGWRAERLVPFYIINSSYRIHPPWGFKESAYVPGHRKLKKPILRDWSTFSWDMFYQDLLLRVRYCGRSPEQMWFVKASWPAAAIAKAKKGEGASLVPLYLTAVFEEVT